MMNRQADGVDIVPQLRPRFSEQRADLLAHRSNTASMRTRNLARVRQLGGRFRTASRAARRLGLQCHDLSMNIQALEVDHRLTQNCQTALGESLELPVEDFVAEFVLRLEVVVEVAFATQFRTLDHIIDRSRGEPALGDERGGGVEDLRSAV
jgi:hypothetical protein